MKKVSLFLSLFSASALFAQEEGASSSGGLSQMLIMIGVALVFFYFILYRTEQKRRKKMNDMRNTLKKGDRVTAMGILGTVHKVEENTVILQLFEGGKIEVLKAAITDVVPSGTNEADQSK